MKPEVSIVLFVFNEEANLERVLTELVEYLDAAPFRWELIFVDDGSADKSLHVARSILPSAKTRFTRHETNRGIGAALKTGAALAEGEYLTFLPGDGQLPPETIGRLFAAREGADLVTSVYESRRKDGPLRKLLSAGVRALIFAVHGVSMESDGPYLIRRTLFDPAQLGSDSFFLNFEVPIRASASKMASRVVPADCRPRLGGRSKTANLKTTARVAPDLIALRFRG